MMAEVPLDSTRESGSSRVAIATAVLLSLALLWSRRAYVPMWDGRIYADCVVDAAWKLRALGGYRCAGHISQSYVAILAVAERLASSVVLAPMLLANALLLLLGAFALLRVMKVVFPGEEHRLGSALVAGCFLLHPVVLGSAVQPGLDFGVLVFALCALAAVMEGRLWWCVIAGLLLVFAKEPGLPLYGVILLAFLWRHGGRQLVPMGARWLTVTALVLGLLGNALTHNLLSASLFAILLLVVDRRGLRFARPPVSQLVRVVLRQWPLLLPIVIEGGYLAWNLLRNAVAPPVTPDQGAQVVWGNSGAGTLIKTVLRPGVIDQPTLAVLSMIFVLCFCWLPTLVTFADMIERFMRRRSRAALRAVAGMDPAAFGTVVAVMLGELWFLSRFRTYANARYYLPLYPLLLAVAYGSLVRLGVTRRARELCTGLLAVLMLVSAVRTVDPVSRALWGTFRLGDQSMLRMTSLTDECCGYGRDQLVYNLQFTSFDALQSAAYSRMQPDSRTALVVAPMADWHTVGPLDAVTRRRTMQRTDTITPPVLDAVMAYRMYHVPAGWFVELPYMDNAESLARLAEVYELGPPQGVRVGSAAMRVRTMRLRSPSLGSLPR